MPIYLNGIYLQKWKLKKMRRKTCCNIRILPPNIFICIFITTQKYRLSIIKLNQSREFQIK